MVSSVMLFVHGMISAVLCAINLYLITGKLIASVGKGEMGHVHVYDVAVHLLHFPDPLFVT
jgi:hypothetical protein